MRIKYLVLLVAIFLTFVSFVNCSKKEKSLAGGPEGGAAPTPFTSLSQNSLKAATLSEIEAVHCPAYESDRSNADAAFGCFLVKLAQMFESAPIMDFLTAFGEPAIHVQADILDPANSNALCTKLANQTNKKYYLEFPKLPFNSYHFNNSSFESFFKEMLKRAKGNGIAISRLQDDLFNLDSQLNQLIDLLAVPRGVADFSFTIPKELCQVSSDIVIHKIDVEGFHGILGSTKIFANLLHSYTIGLNPARFATTTGSVNKREFVADANGVGGDAKKFAELISGRSDLSLLQPLMLSTLNSLVALLDSVHTTSDSEVFGHLLSLRKYKNFFQNVNKAAKDLKSSLEHPGTLTPMTQLGHPGIRLNVNQFLSNLPDPKAVSNADPFVPDRFGQIQAVAAFFKTLLSGIASF